MMYYRKEWNDGQRVFVFGSNLAGRHGAGAALDAVRHWGAIQGIGRGRQGMAYGIPTKDANLKPLPLHVIADCVDEFKAYAAARPRLLFLVTKIGCGLAGFTERDIAPLFRGAPDNCGLPAGWRIQHLRADNPLAATFPIPPYE